jgi:copper chaperone CopZ
MSDAQPRTIARLTISGITSVHAVRAIFTAFAGVDGVVRADVGRGGAVVEHDGTVTAGALEEAVRLAGFELIEIAEERRELPLL